MSNDTIPAPVPEDIDETRSMELRHLSTDARLRSKPVGDQRCGNCAYYLEDTAELSYCWHPKLRILVGERWWCQWWEPTSPDSHPVGAEGDSPSVPSNSDAYIPVRVSEGPRPDGYVNVYLPDGTGFVVNGRQLVRRERDGR